MRASLKKTNRPFPYCIACILTFTGYFAYFVSAVFFVILMAPFFAVFSFNRGLRDGIARKTLRGYLVFLTQRLLPALHVYSISEVSGFSGKAGNAAIYVANHRGRLDALLLLSILQGAGVLIKSKYGRLPLYRALIKYIDFIQVESDTHQSLFRAMDRCKGLLLAGKNILIFPEGARAVSGRLLPFKEFAFRLGLDAGVPVIPVIVHSDYPFMAKLPGSIFPKNKLNYTIRCLEAHFPLDKERPSAFADRVSARMAQELKLLDQGTAWERT
jgi:1-acyl-sn-glycerol-3-phosphate acyltransferase